MGPSDIARWANQVRATGGPAFQLNLWIPGQPAARDAVHEASVRAFLSEWGPPVPPAAGDAVPLDFEAQFDAVCDAAPLIASSVMGLYSPPMVRRLKERRIAWFANVSTVAEARAAEAAGADAVVVQGAEAGGHRGCFPTTDAERQAVGLFSLLPAVADAVRVPVVGTGGIADARGIAAALTLGASAVQIGTGFLRCPEAGISPAWAAALAELQPEDTAVTRTFTGKPGRAIFRVRVRVRVRVQG
jgi:nitronate monooxygenase